MSDLMIFQRVLPRCEQGDREAWKAFLSYYTPIVFRIFDTYFASSLKSREDYWRETLAALAANNYEHLRGFDHQEERDFLIDLRAFLLERAVETLDPGRDSTETPAPTAETVVTLLKGLPLLHREILFLKLCGYSNAGIERLLRITPTVAEKGLERLGTNYSPILKTAEDRCVWPAAWARVVHSARGARQEDCPPSRQFVRIQDGHISWYEKEPVEEHVAGCFHCLERWIALREIGFWRRETKPLLPAHVDAFLSSLPIPAEKQGEKSFLKRILGSVRRSSPSPDSPAPGHRG